MGFIFRPSEFEVQHHGQIFAGQAYAATHDGDLPQTLFWRRMEFRHDLNAARFDHYHENIGFMIEHDANHEMRPMQWIGCMRSRPETGGAVVPLSPQVVPEPVSLVTASIAVGSWLFAAYVLGRCESKRR